MNSVMTPKKAVTVMSMILVHFIALTSATIIIPLDKQYVPVQRKGRVVMYKTAYFGKIMLGSPRAQNFTVIFDTGSAHLFVPSSTCTQEACLSKRLYHRGQSLSALDIDHEGTVIAADATDRDEVQIAYGTGEVEGELIQETVCLANNDQASLCTDTRMIVATAMSDDPFGEFEFDGVLGLGLDSLALDPAFSFFGQAIAQHPDMVPQFAVYLSSDDAVPSEITFGGYDSRRLSGELQWADVAQPELGYWMLAVESVRIGNKTIELCQAGDCVGIMDTGTSLLGVPRQVMQQVNFLLARTLPNDPEDGVDCRDIDGPDVVINVGGVELTLGPKDYSRPAGLRVVDNQTSKTQFLCRAQLLPVDHMEPIGPKTWILGEPMLRKYYSVFDWSKKRIGFAPVSSAPSTKIANQPITGGADSQQKHRVVGSPIQEVLQPTVVHV